MRRPVREHIKDMFALHRAEVQAFRIMTLAIVVAAAWVTYEQWFRRPDPDDLTHERAALDAWLAKEDSVSSVHVPLALAPFDPNDLDLEGWMNLGLTERQARSLLNYATKAGGFDSKADLRRMRVVRPELFAEWEPYILLPDSSGPEPKRFVGNGAQDRTEDGDRKRERTTTTSARSIHRVELNAADTLQLIDLPGIGPSLARAIVGHRERLGGYFSVDQLKELRVLQAHPENLDRFRDRLVVDTLLVRRIPINSCTADQLAAHPYVTWKVAKAIVAYRSMHGPYAQPSDITGCALVTDSLVRKLAPYLSTR